ncbi:hypothetical protein D3C81_1715010 [compost metagenome]
MSARKILQQPCKSGSTATVCVLIMAGPFSTIIMMIWNGRRLHCCGHTRLPVKRSTRPPYWSFGRIFKPRGMTISAAEWPGRRISWITRTPQRMRLPPFWLPVCMACGGIRRIWSGRSVFTNGIRLIWLTRIPGGYGMASTGWGTAGSIMIGNSLTARAYFWAQARNYSG